MECELCYNYLVDYFDNLPNTDMSIVMNIKTLRKQIKNISKGIQRLLKKIHLYHFEDAKDLVSIDISITKKHNLPPNEYNKLLLENLKDCNRNFYDELKDFETDIINFGFLKFDRQDKDFTLSHFFILTSILPLLENILTFHQEHSIKEKVVLKPSLTIRISRVIEDEFGNLYD